MADIMKIPDPMIRKSSLSVAKIQDGRTYYFCPCGRIDCFATMNDFKTQLYCPRSQLNWLIVEDQDEDQRINSLITGRFDTYRRAYR